MIARYCGCTVALERGPTCPKPVRASRNVIKQGPQREIGRLSSSMLRFQDWCYLVIWLRYCAHGVYINYCMAVTFQPGVLAVAGSE